MKRNTFHIAFFGLALCLLSGSTAFGQETKKDKKSKNEINKIEIIIENGDTLINGKSTKKMSKAERAKYPIEPMDAMAPFPAERQMRIYKKEYNDAKREHARAMDEQARHMQKIDRELQELDRLIIIQSDEDGKTYKFHSGNDEGEYEFDVRGPGVPSFPVPPAVMAPGQFEFHINEEHFAPNAQVFTYRNGEKNIQLRMSKANKKELETAKITPEEEHDIQLLANPMKNEISLSYASKQGGAVTLKVFDENGKQIKNETLSTDKAGIAEKIFPLSDFSNGKYFVEFSQGSEKIIRKLQIQQ